jgi:hypothetical protein
VTLLDEWIPEYDVVSRHETLVHARPAWVYQVAREADLGSTLLVRLLLAVRVIPGLIGNLLTSRPHARASGGTTDRRVGRIPFTLLAEDPGHEFVFGLMGQFWKPTGGIATGVTAETFRSPPAPGTAQAMWNVRVEPTAHGSRLMTETRVRCADEATRRRFLRYWRVVRIGSSVTRWSMLRQLKSRAESRD